MKTLYFVLLSTLSFAQLGTLSNIQSVTCPAGYVGQSQCSTATLSCANVPDIQVTWGTRPTSKGLTPAGTIVFVNGQGDTILGGSPVYTNPYKQAGMALDAFTFSGDWENGGDILAAGCRPATIEAYLKSQADPNLPYCAQAVSAGAAGTAYAMAWYGVQFDAVEFMSGPPLSNIAMGCQTPHAAPVTVNPTNGASFTDNPWYDQNVWQSVSSWTGTSCLPPGGSTQGDLASEAAQSLVQTGEVTSFPNTNISAWVCNNGKNPSAAQTYLWLDSVTSPWSLTSITSCLGSEGVSQGYTPQGELGSSAIVADMLTSCAKH